MRKALKVKRSVKQKRNRKTYGQGRLAMKRSMKGLFVILAIVVSLVAVQSVCAETVEGKIDSITIRPPTIVVEDASEVLTEISGVRYNYLCNEYNICLEEGDVVSIEYYEYECSNGTIIFKACKITVDDVTVALRPCP
jgi:translation initiation factor IF-1